MFNNKKELSWEVRRLQSEVDLLQKELKDLFRIVNNLLGELKLEANKKPEDWEIVKTK